MGRFTVRFEYAYNDEELYRLGNITLNAIFKQDGLKYALAVYSKTDDDKYKSRDYIKSEIFVYDEVVPWSRKMDEFINENADMVGYQITPYWYKKILTKNHDQCEFTLYNNEKENSYCYDTLCYLIKSKTTVYYENFKNS